jgi:hypothetical protein
MNCDEFVMARGVSELAVRKRAVYSELMQSPTLSQYIRAMGIDAFCQKHGIKFRAANSWLYGYRRPQIKVARELIANSPVTWEGIYFPNESGSDVSPKGIA